MMEPCLKKARLLIANSVTYLNLIRAIKAQLFPAFQLLCCWSEMTGLPFGRRLSVSEDRIAMSKP